MRWLADEHVSTAIIDRLRQDGHEVVAVAAACPGAEDDEILAMAAASGALVLTADKDFGELIFRQGKACQGVVLIRLSGLTGEAKAAIVGLAVMCHGAEMPGKLSVIEPTVCRVRPIMS